MQCNLGQVEKTVRALVGAPLAISGFYIKTYSNVWGQICLWTGWWLLVTAAFSWCPATWLRQRIKPSD